MKTVEMTDAKDALSVYARRVAKEAVVVTEKGKPVAALVAIENADLETVSLSTNPQFIALIERSRSRLQSEGGISSGEMRRRQGEKQVG